MHGGDSHSQAPSKRRARWQWSVGTLMLLTAAVGAWTAYFQVTRQVDKLRTEIETMQSVARTLTVSDLEQYAVVEEHEMWYDDNRWRIYLPEGRSYQIKLATREIEEREMAPAGWQQPIEPGRHRVKLDYAQEDDMWRIVVFVDDEPVIEAAEPVQWHSGKGWSESGGHSRAEQSSLEKPLVLMRRRFMVAQPGGGSRTPQAPGPGILLWIETADDDPASAEG